MAISPLGIVFDARNVPALAEFWHQATGFEIVDSGERATRLAPKGTNLRYILIQKVPEEKTTKNSCHVDFETDDREADVERLVSAGAIKVADHSGGRFKWTVLQDPEGNEFCIGSEIGE